MLDISAPRLKSALKAVFHAISTDEALKNLNSLLFKVEGGKLKLVATDGHRMAIVTTLAAFDDQAFSVTLRRAQAAAALKAIKPGAACGLSAKGLTIDDQSFDNVFAPFPPFEQVLVTPPLSVETDAEHLATIAEGFAKMVPKKKGGAILQTIGKATLALSIEGRLSGRVSIETTAVKSTFSVGINPTYLKDAAAAVGPGTVAISAQGRLSLDPLRLDAERPEFKFTAIIMPMRV